MESESRSQSIRPAEYLSFSQAQSPATAAGSFRFTRYAVELRPARAEHSRSAGFGTAERGLLKQHGPVVCGACCAGSRAASGQTNRKRISARAGPYPVGGGKESSFALPRRRWTVERICVSGVSH